MGITFVKIAVLFVFSIFGSIAYASHSHPNYFQKIEQQIEKGELEITEQQLKKIKQSRTYSLHQKYHCSKLLSKIYLNQQKFNKYSLEVDQLIRLSKFLNPIYQSEAYAHKAYYWHYMMWSDSALIYSNKSMAIYRTNERFRAKIDIPFIYEIHAITYLYRNDNKTPQCYLNLPISDLKKKQYQWFDSAVYYEQRFPFRFSIDRSMLFRSYANRWLDEVAGRKGKKSTPMQLLAFEKAKALYDQGLASLKPWHYNDILTINGLKAAIHTYIHRYKEADDIFKDALNSIPDKTLMNRIKLNYQPLMVFLTFKVRNTIFLPYDEKKINADISLLLKLRKEFWKSFDTENDLPYDPYLTSPYINLFNLYATKAMYHKSNSQYMDKAVSYLLTLKVHFHFIKKGNIKQTTLPYFDVKNIQKKLNNNECYLFMHSENDLLESKKVLITKNKIQFVNSKRSCSLNRIDIDTLPFNEFKKYSFEAYQDNLEEVLKVFPKAKKIFISHDDLIPYEALLKNTDCNSYRNANFAGNQINFVRLYNPYTYFDEPIQLQKSSFDVRILKQRNVSRLHFMDDFFNHFSTQRTFSKKFYQGDFKKLLKNKGILHLYGHGEFTLDDEAKTFGFQIQYEANHNTKAERKLSGDFVCNRDLVVLNNCFSGYPFYNVNEFNKTIPLRILSNGAKALICSPSKVDDYYSAEFFKLFYQKVETGTLYDDAFFEAKQQFVKEHPEMRNPIIWNGLQLIVSNKVYNSTKETNSSVLYFLVIISIFDTILIVLYVFLHRKKQLRRLTITPH